MSVVILLASQAVVRVRAAAALGAMLRVVHERQSTSHFVEKLLDEAGRGEGLRAGRV